MSEHGQRILQRAKRLEDVRRDYEDGLWNDIGKFVYPRREDLRAHDHSMLKGRRTGRSSYSDTAQNSLNIWADGMQGFLVSESMAWFKTEMSIPMLNRIPEVIEWLQEYDEAMYAEFRNSNFYTAMPMYLRDGGSIGTATLFTEEDIVSGTQVHTSIHPREVFIAENRYGKVDTVFRKFEKTARQLVQEFKVSNLPENVVHNAKILPSYKYLLWHAVWPNEDTWTPKKGNAAFRSDYVISRDAASQDAGHSAAVSPSGGLGGEKDVIHEGAFEFDPYAVWRFRKNSDEVYGRSPAADAIVSIFKDNQFSKTLLDTAHRASKPAVNAPERMRGRVRLGPGGMNYYENPQDVISEIPAAVNYPIAKDREDALKRTIEDRYGVQLFTFLLNSEREKTAFEIERIESQMATLVGPQVDQLYTEGLEPIFNNVAEIADRAGRLPPPPDIVREAAERLNVRILARLTGPLAQAQSRMLRLGPIRAGNNELAMIAETYGPGVLDRVNVDEMVEEVLDAVNYPRRLINSDEKVAEIQEQRAAEIQQQQQMEMMAGAAEAAPKLAKAAEPGSPLEAIGELV